MDAKNIVAEPRLQNRYRILVHAHVKTSTAAATAPVVLPGSGSAEAACMGLYRFLGNDAVTPAMLVQPLHDVLKDHFEASANRYVLVAHDESILSFGRHKAKTDRLERTHKNDVGYELSTALAIDTADGAPIAPIAMRLCAADAVHGTIDGDDPKLSVHDQVLPRMELAAKLFPKPVFVHVMDREFDSIGHFRAWNKAGHRFLVRGKGNRRVRWRGESARVDTIPQALHAESAFQLVGPVERRGVAAELWVAEVDVTRDRPAKPRQGGRQGKSREVPGEPLTLRLIFAEIRPKDGEPELWILYTNVPSDVDHISIARWYYWRWRIESFYKLLKTAGLEVESWKQRNGLLIFKRLLLAAMALSLVYRIAQSPGAEAEASRKLLVRLSGRLMRHTVKFTIPALLAGLYALLQIQSAMEVFSHDELELAKAFIMGRSPPK